MWVSKMELPVLRDYYEKMRMFEVENKGLFE